jgi:hypothetical protein
MMAKSVGMPKIPIDTPANRRLAMEEMCAILCRKDEDARAIIARYEELKAKYRKSKRRLSELRLRCVDLSDEIDRNRQKLAEHMSGLHRQEQSAIDEKLGRLEEMIGFQIEEQKRLIADERLNVESSPRRSRNITRETITQKKASEGEEATEKAPEVTARKRQFVRK